MNIPCLPSKKGTVLLAGCGGGFDFLCALPVALELEARGYKTIIASYSFTRLKSVKKGRWLTGEILEIDASSYIDDFAYFPELALSQWFLKTQKKDRPIYCFPGLGIKSLTGAFNYLKENFDVSALYIVDGGVDGIFRGDEYDLGTPSMDSISIIAGAASSIEEKHYVMTAFGSEGVSKEVSHADVLNRIADLTAKDRFRGVASLLKDSSAGSGFLQACRYIFTCMSEHYRSTIVASIMAAMEGQFGDTGVNEKTIDRPVWLSPLTHLYWFFDLTGVAEEKLFYKEVLDTDSVTEVSEAIEKLREGKKRKRRTIPI